MDGTIGERYSVGLDPNLVNPPPRLFRSTTVLTRAITSTASRQTKYLLEKGCDPNGVVSRRHLRPLMVACFVIDSKKRMYIIRHLVKHGADPTLRDVHGRNSIMYTCALGLGDETQLMVKDCDYDLNATDMYGDTVLHMCAKAGNAQVLGVVLGEMLRYEMDISVQNHSYLTPLSLAILNGNHECAEMLHQAGGSPRFSELKLPRVMWLLSGHRKISSAGVKAIHDSKAVGEAFGPKFHFLGSASIIGEAITSPVWEGSDGRSACTISSTGELHLKLPSLLPVCGR